MPQRRKGDRGQEWVLIEGFRGEWFKGMACGPGGWWKEGGGAGRVLEGSKFWSELLKSAFFTENCAIEAESSLVYKYYSCFKFLAFYLLFLTVFLSTPKVFYYFYF